MLQLIAKVFNREMLTIAVRLIGGILAFSTKIKEVLDENRQITTV